MRRSPLFAWLAAFGAAIELFQALPALHRDAEVLDWLADMAAAAVALGLVRWALAPHLERFIARSKRLGCLTRCKPFRASPN